ncbi:collagen alpha-1(I) chain-like isoform X2 [Balaenoptera musculus]|uniref:Collagen alpha-1(I) chain-like isoform X2 n=1 Tax=Balaenoptera musculus TaxID=9771 RepID=A0A8B8W482_BALMU|nr:collagen alpha-1(I) chain-like isoform X2 [Balaenoptera musculus]
MCHQHVEPARAAPRAGGTPLTFEGSRRLTPLHAAPGPRSSGRWRQRPPGPGRVERGPGPRPGARGAPGTSGRLLPTTPGRGAGSAAREGEACGASGPAGPAPGGSERRRRTEAKEIRRLPEGHTSRMQQSWGVDLQLLTPKEDTSSENLGRCLAWRTCSFLAGCSRKSKK